MMPGKRGKLKSIMILLVSALLLLNIALASGRVITSDVSLKLPYDKPLEICDALGKKDVIYGQGDCAPHGGTNIRSITSKDYYCFVGGFCYKDFDYSQSTKGPWYAEIYTRWSDEYRLRMDINSAENEINAN